MQHPPAAVRLSLLTLVVAAFAMALVQPVQAGTPEAPEIQDPVNDQALLGEGPANPACAIDATACLGSRIDVVSVWIDEETADQFNVNILLTNVPGGATTASARWEFHATFGETEVVATSVAEGGQQALQPPVPGDNVAAVAVEDTTLILTIAKSVYGSVGSGSQLTGIFVSATSYLPALPVEVPIATDRAPNADGVTYTFGGAGGPAPNPNDTDGDGLNDTWEEQYFGNITAQNATGDPDGDGLTNGQEEALGTDPTKADTDGDGVNDKDDPYPTDPTRGGTSTGTGTGTGTSTGTGTTSATSTTTGTRTSSTTGAGAGAGGGGDGAVESLQDAIDRLESNPGYLGLSGGGLLAVLVLCIIALAVRWSL